MIAALAAGLALGLAGAVLSACELVLGNYGPWTALWADGRMERSGSADAFCLVCALGLSIALMYVAAFDLAARLL